MLRSIKDLEKLAIRATDGTIGHALDFFFDDERWTIRYLVVDTGTWLPSTTCSALASAASFCAVPVPCALIKPMLCGARTAISKAPFIAR